METNGKSKSKGTEIRDSDGLSPFEVRPRHLRYRLFYFLGGGGIAAACLGYAIAGTETWLRLLMLFVVAIPLFLIIARGLLVPPTVTSMVLDSEGVKQISAYGTALIPWIDIEEISVVEEQLLDASSVYVALRLSSPESYLQSMTKPMVQRMEADMRFGRHLMWYLVKVVKPLQWVTRLWDSFCGTNWTDKISACEKLKTYTDLLRYNKELYGYDVIIDSGMLDRTPQEFVQLLEQFRHRFPSQPKSKSK